MARKRNGRQNRQQTNQNDQRQPDQQRQTNRQPDPQTGFERPPQASSKREQMITDANANIDEAFGRGRDMEQTLGEQTVNQPAPYSFNEGKLQQPSTQQAMPEAQVIGPERLREGMKILKKYRDGKKTYEHNIVTNEMWFKERHWKLMDKNGQFREDPKPSSAWLFNTITSKHADFMDNAPMCDILPREADDQEEAEMLTSIVPVILDENNFGEVYDDEIWYKLKHGTGVFGVYWDQDKLNGLGDISVECVDILELFWEPGVRDIQKSANVFHVELVDNETLEQAYPDLKGKLKSTSDSTTQKYYYDENISTTGKSAVIDWYYKKTINGKQTVQFIKFVDENLLYATENDTRAEVEPQAIGKYDQDGNPALKKDGTYDYDVVEVQKRPSMAETGLYNHGEYPFVFDVLFPEAGMPTGFGLIQVCKSPQASIDIMNNCLEKNMQHTANPRYLVRRDGGVNKAQFADPNNLIVDVDGNLGQDSFAPISVPQMISSNYLSMVEMKITEMKETSGNRDVNNGGTTAGATAASAVAALQEASGKLSRDHISTSFRAYKKVVKMVIELIRQFYDMPRQFRITGKDGQPEFVSYSNERLQDQPLGDFGIDAGMRRPEFDLKVEAEKQSSYTKMSQNELALQLFNNGVMNPQMCDQALMLLDMMDFQGKSDLQMKVAAQGGMYQQMLQMQQQMLQMSQIIDQLTGGQSNIAEQMAAGINQDAATLANQEMIPNAGHIPTGQGESAVTAKARSRAADTTAPR